MRSATSRCIDSPMGRSNFAFRIEHRVAAISITPLATRSGGGPSDDWLTIASSSGPSELSGRNLWPCPHGFNRWYSPGPVRGTIDVGDDSVRIDLQVVDPRSNAKWKWIPYEFNGTWPVESPSEDIFTPSFQHDRNCEKGSPPQYDTALP
jgi:hypothetical protein